MVAIDHSNLGKQLNKVEAASRIAKNSIKAGLDDRGQATVEYAIVGLVLLAVIMGLVAIADRLEEGLFVEHAADSASHSAGPNTMGVIGDVLLY